MFLAPARLEGREHLPREGGYIIVANHVSWMDPLWIEFLIRRAIRYMTKSEVFEIPFLGGLVRAIGSFPVRRGASDRRALMTCLKVVAAGQPLGLFPEGHRSPNAALIRAHPGVGFIARRTGAPLVPVAVIGTERAKLGRFWRRDILVRIGDPFTAAEVAPDGDDEAVADAIMRRIAALLPPERRGAYA